MSQTITDEGLILRTQPYQENDLLVSVYFAPVSYTHLTLPTT